MAGLEQLDGRVAVVTGAASGIGREIAAALVRQGVTVVAADVDPALNSAAAEIGATPWPTDVRDPAAVQRLAETVLDRFGRVDIVVNNAGVGPLAPIDELTLEDFRWVLDINLMGVVHGIKAFLPHLKANPHGGFVVNTSSMAGLIAGPGMGAYSASKFAVVALTEVLAAELAAAGSAVGAAVLTPAVVRTNIALNAQKRPGNVDGTDDGGVGNLPPGRVLEPEDVADLVLDAIRTGRLYVVTHPETLPVIEHRHAQIQQAFADAAATSPVA